MYIYQQPSDLKNRCFLFILVHLGGQTVEFQGHPTQVGKELVFIGLFSKEAESVLQALEVEHEVAVLVMKWLYVLRARKRGREEDRQH